jgi:hypothetical protein
VEVFFWVLWIRAIELTESAQMFLTIASVRDLYTDGCLAIPPVSLVAEPGTNSRSV